MTSRSLTRNALARPRPVRADPVAPGPRARRAWWPWLKRALLALFFAFVTFMIVRFALQVDWPEVWASVRALPRGVLLAAAGFALLSHLLYSCFDLIGRRYTSHGLATRRVMQVGFISYAFNLNMGSAVGGVGFRLRLYSRMGLTYGHIARVVSLSMLTNWLGYLLLAGALFAFTPLELPPSWRLDSDGLSLVGLGLLAVVLSYVVLCAWARQRSWTIRGHELLLPRWRMALVQLALSAANWMAIAAVIWTLLRGELAYAHVLGVFLLAAIAGVVVRVPAGLGVVEAVFIALLSHRIPETQLLGALLAYRALYYIAPLAIAALLYLRLELHARHKRRRHARAA